jgi:hypothetical protein
MSNRSGRSLRSMQRSKRSCGLGAFVSRQFLDQEISDPRPGLNLGIIGGTVFGEAAGHQPCLFS